MCCYTAPMCECGRPPCWQTGSLLMQPQRVGLCESIARKVTLQQRNKRGMSGCSVYRQALKLCKSVQPSQFKQVRKGGDTGGGRRGSLNTRRFASASTTGWRTCERRPGMTDSIKTTFCVQKTVPKSDTKNGPIFGTELSRDWANKAPLGAKSGTKIDATIWCN